MVVTAVENNAFHAKIGLLCPWHFLYAQDVPVEHTPVTKLYFNH